MEQVNIATFILDDDADLLELIKETIDKAGIKNYKLFTNEQDFIDGLTEEIHICVVDHILPRKTGLDILGEIKAKNANSFVIGYSGIKDAKTLIEYINHDLDRFVDKDKENHLEILTTYLLDGLTIAMRRISFAAFLKLEKNKRTQND